VIALEGVAARRAPLALANVSLTWGAGVHAVIGGNSDGGPLLLALIAGKVRPRTGRVRVLDGDAGDRAVRPQVAFIPLEPALPDAMRVAEVLTTAAVIRREPEQDPAERLSALGVQSLATRRASTLSREEGRAVAIAEAATSTRVRVLLIEEPLLALDPRAASRLPDLLRASSREDRAVIIATASVRDAAELANDYVLLRGGAAVGQASSVAGLAGLSPHGAHLRILASEPRALAVALAREEGVEAVALRNLSVTVRGRNALDLARAAGRAIVASGVDVIEMHVELPSLDEIRSTVGPREATALGQERSP
jgi:ABC-2 type transport system ATP-binding protein